MVGRSSVIDYSVSINCKLLEHKENLTSSGQELPDVRLKLTRRLRRHRASAAGRASRASARSRAMLREALGARLRRRSTGSRSRAAPTRASTRSPNVVSVEVAGGPPPERAAEALNAVLPDDVAVVRAEEAPPDFHARHSARSRSYRYRIWRLRARSPFEVEPLALASAPARPAAAPGFGRDARRRARLPRLHADRDPARGLRPRRRGRPLARPRRRGRARDHGRLAPPPHGEDARRHDAREASRTRCSSSCRAPRARPPARRPRRAGSTSSASAMTR